MTIEDQKRERTAEQMSDLYSGLIVLERLAAWAYVVANQRAVLDYLVSFERAYEEFVKLHAAGKLGAGASDFSEENLERVRRISLLIPRGLESDEARQVAQEVHTLAERCLQGLRRSEASGSGGTG